MRIGKDEPLPGHQLLFIVEAHNAADDMLRALALDLRTAIRAVRSHRGDVLDLADVRAALTVAVVRAIAGQEPTPERIRRELSNLERAGQRYRAQLMLHDAVPDLPEVPDDEIAERALLLATAVAIRAAFEEGRGA